MKLEAIIACIVLMILLLGLLFVAWNYLSPNILPPSHGYDWLAGVIIWFISIVSGIWYCLRWNRSSSK